MFKFGFYPPAGETEGQQPNLSTTDECRAGRADDHHPAHPAQRVLGENKEEEHTPERRRVYGSKSGLFA